MRKILFIAAVLFSLVANAQTPPLADSLHERTFSAKEFRSVRLPNLATGASYRDSGLALLNGTMVKVAPSCNWPAEVAYGTLYEKSSWSDLYDFTKHGSNITLARNGNYIDLGGGVGTWGEYVSIGDPTLSTYWTDSAVFKTTAWSGTAYGTAIGVHTSATYNFGVFAYVGTTSTGSTQLYIISDNGTVYASTGVSVMTYSLNDVISLKASMVDSVFTATVKNLTVGGGDTLRISYTFAPNTYIRPNASYHAIAELGGTHQYQYIKSWSDEKKNANLMVFANSKGWYYPSNWRNSLFGILDSAYHTTTVHAGAANTLAELAATFKEVIRLNPRQLLMSEPVSNTIRYGASLSSVIKTYDSLVSIATNAGITVFHAVAPEDTVGTGGTAKANMTAFKNYVAAKYVSTYIDTWTAMSGPTNRLNIAYNYGDSIHWNAAGVRAYANAIVASGKITVCDNRIGLQQTPIFPDPIVDSLRKNSGSSGVTLSGSNNYIMKKTGSNSLGASQITDDGTNIALAGATTVNNSLSVTGYSLFSTSIGSQTFDGNMSDASHIMEVRGAVKTIGSNSALQINRQDNNGFAIGLYSPAGQLKVVNYGNSNIDWITGATNGKIKFPSVASVTQTVVDTTTWKVLVADGSGNMEKMNWPSAGGGSGLTSFGTPSGTSNANGATYSGGVGTLTYADATNPGIMKKYTSTGSNTDGTMDQNSITTALSGKEVPLTFSGGLTRSSNTITLGGTLNASTNILGAGNAMQIGTSGSNISTLDVNASGKITLNAPNSAISLQGAIATPNSLIDGAPASQTLSNSYSKVITTNASVVSTPVTYTLPASPPDGMNMWIDILGTGTNGNPSITTFSVVANSGQTLMGPTVTTANYGDSFWFHYSALTTTWIRRH